MTKIIFSLVFIVLTASCHQALKEVSDYFPTVTTVSAAIQADGSVLVQGQIEAEGAAPIDYVGFSCSTRAQPDLTERQIIADYPGDSTFSAIYTGFEPDSTYYFQAWATNEYGYTVGKVFSLSGIIAAPVTAPCALTPNTCNIGGFQPTADYYIVNAPTSNLNYWEIRGQTYSGPLVDYTFGSVVTTGIFTTTTSTSPGPGEVFVSFISDALYAALDAGSKVYVNTISPGVHEITICQAPWRINGGSAVYFNSRMRTPL